MLVLEDGTVFPGESVGAAGFACGEAVFTTAMTGYQEIATDPSFAEQLVCFTAPMVGNYGVDQARSESARPHARAVLHARGARPRVDRLAARARNRRAHRRRHAQPRAEAPRRRRDARGGRVRRLRGRRGARHRTLARRDARPRARRGRLDERAVHLQRRRHDARRGRRLRLQAVDPAPSRARRRGGHRVPARRRRRRARRATTASCSRTARATPSRSTRRPPSCATCSAACRCSGSASATSCSAARPASTTSKLPFGHRGANHPVLERASGRVLVTAQNHGFCVDAAERPRSTHVSLYDGTVEGLAFPELRARSLQFHPEAGPGPHDAWPLLEGWVERVALPRRDRSRVDPPHRLRADRDRAGVRVRLRRLPGAEGAARGRLPHDRRQLEPGDDHDRPRLRRPRPTSSRSTSKASRRCCAASGPTRCCRRWAARRRSTSRASSRSRASSTSSASS